MQKKISFVLLIVMLTACGKPPASPHEPDKDGGTTSHPDDVSSTVCAHQWEAPADYRCNKIGAIKTLRNNAMIEGVWYPLQEELIAFPKKIAALQTATTTYCSSKTEADYKKLVGNYKIAYSYFGMVAVYSGALYQLSYKYFQAPLPINKTKLDAAIANPSTSISDNEAWTLVGFPILNQLIFVDKEKLKTDDKYCEYLTKIVLPKMKEKSDNLQQDWNKFMNIDGAGVGGFTTSVVNSTPKEQKHLLADFVKWMERSLGDLVTAQQALLDNNGVLPETVLQQLSKVVTEAPVGNPFIPYGDDYISVVQGAVKSIQAVYRGKPSAKSTFENRLCLYEKDIKTKENSPAQKIDNLFSQILFLLDCIKGQSLIQAYKDAQTNENMKAHLKLIINRLSQLKNSIRVDFANNVALTECQGPPPHKNCIDNDGD